MKTIRVMSIIGCVLFALTLICIIAFMETDPLASMGWGIIGSFYGIALSVVGIVQSQKK